MRTPSVTAGKVRIVYVKNRENADSSLVLEPNVISSTYKSHANDYFSTRGYILSVAFTIFNLECVCTMGILYNAVNKI